MSERKCRVCALTVGLYGVREGGLCKRCGHWVCERHGWMLLGEGDWFCNDCQAAPIEVARHTCAASATTFVALSRGIDGAYGIERRTGDADWVIFDDGTYGFRLKITYCPYCGAHLGSAEERRDAA